MMIDENKVSTFPPRSKNGCDNGNCPSYIHEVIGYYKKNNGMVYNTIVVLTITILLYNGTC
jgi:hypothetical protein